MDLHDGLRPFQSLTSLQKLSLKPSSLIGSLVLVFHKSLPPIGASNSNFESHLFASLISHFLGFTRIGTAAYHPMVNGLVKRFHRQLKASLKATEDPSHWTERLPLMLLGIRTAVKADLGHSFSERVYGTTLCLPGEFFSLNIAKHAFQKTS